LHSVSAATRERGSVVENRVGDLVGDLVGVAFGDRFGSEEEVVRHAVSPVLKSLGRMICVCRAGLLDERRTL
jgi:hypothetical protein